MDEELQVQGTTSTGEVIRNREEVLRGTRDISGAECSQSEQTLKAEGPRDLSFYI